MAVCYSSAMSTAADRRTFDLLDPAPVDDAWLSLEGGVATYLRQLREPVPGEPRRSTPFRVLSQK